MHSEEAGFGGSGTGLLPSVTRSCRVCFTSFYKSVRKSLAKYLQLENDLL